MAYFTAVIARSGSSWKARDVEVDEAGSLDELADSLRQSAVDDQPVLAVIEHEDEWFALVRVDGEDEPRLFVSDLPAAMRSHYAGLLAAAADVDVDDPQPADEDAEESGGDSDPDDDAEPAEPVALAWAGDPDLLDDLGVSGRVLRKLSEDRGDDPGTVLAEVGETVGFAGLLDALR